ncbi:MAG TPA: response regulator, partial [Sphingomicrobium sp.]|nr:response regulator [Sphingomicrobium sp.]
ALVVLDCAMPTMSGVEVLRQIRASPTCFDTPVLMLTGRRSEADEEIAIRAGANDYMRKPFAVDELVSRVEDLLEAGTRPGTTLFNRCRPLAGERGQASPTGEDSEPVSLRSAST